jgi:hypothetical protein
VRLARAEGCRVRLPAKGRRPPWNTLSSALPPRLVARIKRTAAARGFNLEHGWWSVAAFPELAALWHPTRNGRLVPLEVAANSKRVVWWKCANGPDHEWQDLPVHTGRWAAPCPYCDNRKVSVTNELARLHPALAAEWHPTRNGSLRPEAVTHKSPKVVWWRCSRNADHEWQAQVYHRAQRGTGCPHCRLKNIVLGRSLAATAPAIARQWHPTLNAPRTPRDVTPGANLRVWWQCNKGPDHVWQASIDSRVRDKLGCPFCAGRRASVTNSVAAQRPELTAEWHPSRNGSLTPDQVPVTSSQRVWWRCAKNSRHTWSTEVSQRTGAPEGSRGSGCPFCGNRRASSANSLAARDPRVAAQWHPTKNGDLRPRDVVAGSPRVVWWKCPEGPDHEWRARIGSRTGTQRHGCPFCAGLRLSVTNCLAARRPDVAAQWHPTKNGDLTPRDVIAGSKRRVWWKCEAGDDHEWCVAVGLRARGTGCPFCSGLAVARDTSLAYLFPEIAAEWHPTRNGPLSPAQVTPGSDRRVWWRCSKDARHVWDSLVRARGVQGGGCPYCNPGPHHRVLREESLAGRFPRIAAEWDRKRNGRLRPEEFSPGSRMQVWWRCRRGHDHLWRTEIGARTRGSGKCPFCAGYRVSVTNSLAKLHPRLALEWDLARNRGLSPKRVVATSTAAYWWRCPRGHSWRCAVRDRVGGGRACPVCAEGLERSRSS